MLFKDQSMAKTAASVDWLMSREQNGITQAAQLILFLK